MCLGSQNLQTYSHLAHQYCVVGLTYKFSSDNMFMNDMANPPFNPLAERFLQKQFMLQQVLLI